MKRSLVPVVIVGMLGCPLAVAANPERLEWTPERVAAARYPITPEAAIASARQWASAPTLALKVTLLRRDLEEFERAYYQLTSPDGQEFEVNCYTGWVYHWVDRSAVAEYEQQLQGRKQVPRSGLPEREIVRFGQDFAQARYPGYGDMGLARKSGLANEVSFLSRLSAGEWFDGNWCVVTLNQFTGRPLTYRAGRSGVYNGAGLPVVSRTQAEGLAFAQFAGRAAVAVTYAPTDLVATADVLGQCRLMWICRVALAWDPNYLLPPNPDQDLGEVGLRDVWIDAANGAVIEVIEYLGGAGTKPSKNWHSSRVKLARKPGPNARPGTTITSVTFQGQRMERLSYPPLLRKGSVFWYAGYLQSPLWRMTIQRRSKLTEIQDARGRNLRFRDNSTRFLLNGKEQRATVAPQVLGGRLYLPLDAWEQITGDRFILNKSPASLAIRRSTAGS